MHREPNVSGTCANDVVAQSISGSATEGTIMWRQANISVGAVHFWETSQKLLVHTIYWSYILGNFPENHSLIPSRCLI